MLQCGGFQGWRRVRDFAWGLKKMSISLRIAAVFDRDYFDESELRVLRESLGTEIHSVRILDAKEIENYLLCPKAIAEALRKILNTVGQTVPTNLEGIVETALYATCEEFRADTLGQFIAKAVQARRSSGEDPSTTSTSTIKMIDTLWKTPESRLRLVPGKDVFKVLRRRFHSDYGIHLRESQVIREMKPADFSPAFREILQMLSSFLTPDGVVDEI